MCEWPTRALSELADIRISNVDKKSAAGEKPVRLCNYMDAYSNDYIRSDIEFMEATASASEIARFSVAAGDLVLTKDSETPDDIGIPAVVMDQVDDLVCGYHLALLKTRLELVDPVYLCKQLSTSRVAQYFGQRATGSTRYGLPNRALATFHIPVPPLAVQRTIARVLQTIDTAIEKTEALIAKHQQIKAGLMHDLFTRGVLPNGQLRPPRSEAPELYQETAMGWIPRDWSLHRCADLCTRICVGIVIQPTQYYVEEGVPALRSANVREEGIDPSNFVYISASANRQLAKSQLKAGDIVSVRTGYPGTSAVVPQEFEGANCIDILISTPGEKVRSDYLCDWINSSFGKEQVLRQQGGMAQQHFNVGEMRELLVALPDLDEQSRIREKLEAVTHTLAVERARLEKFRVQKLGLMQDLLTGRVLVPVDEPEPVHA
ncbi:MAG: restriction endonuclease subunit S [Hydrogenophaga sp.]|uniref:restriction endonuclease subunit S n=1 Tax=Hydrogenophaga sp. TaxID=1904254 RepID=UPI002605CB1C|nr:restriction endonuclease subunit S [Hydrogenophaga sp.]MCV0438430.1 restriction endonuclease subunit S [Hydrogenophaga sp.]